MSAKRTVIAVIDDNVSLLGAMGRLLEVYGYGTELYASAAEFLQEAISTDAICLIIDVQLGGSCGIGLARQLATSGFTFPIIFMTANPSEGVEREAAAVGCVAFLHKPFSPESLLQVLVDFPPRGRR